MRSQPAPWSLRRHLTLANTVTTASLLAGFAALLLAMGTGAEPHGSRLRVVGALICAAAFLDADDGPLARRRHTAGPFGCNLDSLADIVSFGVTSAAALYVSELHRVPVAGALASAAFCACGAWRLARFPLCPPTACFVGDPIPVAAVLAAVTLTVPPGPIVTLAMVSALSHLMVGTFAFPKRSAVLPRVRHTPPR